MQRIYIPIPGFADSTQNTDKCLAAWQMPSGVAGSAAELQLTVEGVLSTDTILMRYMIARVATLGSTPTSTFNGFQANRVLSYPAPLLVSLGPFGTDPVPVSSSTTGTVIVEAPWRASVIPQRECFRPWNPNDIAFKEGEIWGLFVNILGTTNTNLKFNGYLDLWI